MTTFEVVEAKRFHVWLVASALRTAHAAALREIGSDPRESLVAAYRSSTFRRSWLIDGEVAAIGGVEGSVLSPAGRIWVAFTDRAVAHPVALVREARKQIAEIMSVKTHIESIVFVNDPAAWRLASFLGFHLKRRPGIPSVADLTMMKRDGLNETLQSEFCAKFPSGAAGVFVGYQLEAAHG